MVSLPISNIPHLSDLGIDLNMPCDQNFGYYTTHEFHSNNDVSECLSNYKAISALHCNIRSISANYENLLNMLTDLYFSFSLIGLSETWIRVNKELVVNINMTNNSF